MISVDDAINRITCSVERLQSEVVHLAESHGRILAKDVKAPTSHPPFNVSSMDGYAIKSKDTGKVPTILKKIGEVPAGDQFSGILKAGEAIRLFTGSRISDGADTVVIQENTKSDLFLSPTPGIRNLEKYASQEKNHRDWSQPFLKILNVESLSLET